MEALPRGLNNQELVHLQQAREEELLSDESMATLNRIAFTPQAALPSSSEFQGRQVNGLVFLGDDSYSMREAPSSLYTAESLNVRNITNKADALVVGQNALVNILQNTPNAETWRMQTSLINAGILEINGESYLPIIRAILLKRGFNYHPDGDTRFFDRAAELISRALLWGQGLRAARASDVRLFLSFATDGADSGSKLSGLDVRPLVQDARDADNMKVFFLGLAMEEDQGNIETFLEMGLKDDEIIKPGGNPAKIFRNIESSVQAMQRLSLMSKNAVRALPSGEVASMVKQETGK